MAEVLVLPGVERRDLVGPAVPAAEVLQATIEKGITDVVIVGRHRDGSQYIAGSINDVDKVIGVLFAAATFLASGAFDQGIPEENADEPREPT